MLKIKAICFLVFFLLDSKRFGPVRTGPEPVLKIPEIWEPRTELTAEVAGLNRSRTELSVRFCRFRFSASVRNWTSATLLPKVPPRVHVISRSVCFRSIQKETSCSCPRIPEVRWVRSWQSLHHWPNCPWCVGNCTGNPGVFQRNPYPYPWKPVPVCTGMGFVWVRVRVLYLNMYILI